MELEQKVRKMEKMCLGKKMYRSLPHAVKKAKDYDIMFSTKNYVYYCPLCGKYHLTTHKRPGFKYENT